MPVNNIDSVYVIYLKISTFSYAILMQKFLDFVFFHKNFFIFIIVQFFVSIQNLK